MATEVTPATKLTRAAIRAEIDTLAAKHYGLAPGEPRVVGIHAAPEAELRDEFPHTVAGRPTTVHVVPCVSALAAYEALVDRDRDAWLVLVTDRSEEDLGEGVRARLIGQRLRLIDPWLGVRTAFGATGIDRSLTRLPQDREVANGLLALISRTDITWPAAPAGLLTLDHVAGAIAGRELGLTGNGIDGIAVLIWLARSGAMARLGELRRIGGDAVADTLVDWLASRTRAAKDLVAAHLREGRPGVLLPLGIATQVLRDARARDPEAAAAWERFRADAPAPLARPEVAEELGTIATTVVDDLLQSRDGWLLAEAVLAEADRLLAVAGGAAHAAASPLLPSGLAARFSAVADALRGHEDPGAAWAHLIAHSLIQQAPPGRLPAAYAPTQAALRLTRWLATEPAPATTLADHSHRLVADHGWVDSAIHDAAGGVTDTALSTAIAEVVTAARERRALADGGYAEALARACRTGDGTSGALAGDGYPVHPLEHVLRTLVVPLAKVQSALLLVLDGMTARVAAELVDDLHATGRGWVEALWPGHQARAAAVAVLPTVTEHSRTSLLCGKIMSGSQQTERTEHPAYVTSLGGGSARIFHKNDLDSVEDGYRLAHPVHDAIADVTGVGLVTCVLNTIDDALDRSDPEGIEWRLPTVKHLDALLDVAATMGRPVILTSDHGHVLERRKGRLDLPAGATATSARSRSAEPAPGVGELLVEGPRVIGGRAVLAVDELLRYSKLKAGYHGGAAAAEVAVPVVLLWPGTPPPDSGYAEASIQQPAWWDVPTGGFAAPPAATPELPAAPTLFDLPADTSEGLGLAVVGSAVWRRQIRTAGRFDLSADGCAALLEELAAANGARQARPAIARALGIAEGRVSGAVAQLVKVLNVEGYPVLREDAGMVVLDPELLAEQFEVHS